MFTLLLLSVFCVSSTLALDVLSLEDFGDMEPNTTEFKVKFWLYMVQAHSEAVAQVEMAEFLCSDVKGDKHFECIDCFMRTADTYIPGDVYKNTFANSKRQYGKCLRDYTIPENVLDCYYSFLGFTLLKVNFDDLFTRECLDELQTIRRYNNSVEFPIQRNEKNKNITDAELQVVSLRACVLTSMASYQAADNIHKPSVSTYTINEVRLMQHNMLLGCDRMSYSRMLRDYFMAVNGIPHYFVDPDRYQ